MTSASLNEETVKNTIVLPFLRRIGVAVQELEFETSFTLRLGTKEISPPRVHGRLDILVRRNGKGYFIVETKRHAAELSEGDKDQAISYALLLKGGPAPFVLVTNGREFRLYDALSREEVEGELIAKRGLRVTLPKDIARIREQALELFLGYSLENLTAYCRAQVEAEMAPLRGSVHDRRKKYIPELFEPRRRQSDQVRSFLDSPASTFVTLADPGSGKTCFACNLAEQLLAGGQAVLFYRGTALTGSLLAKIADDFSWSFSEDESPRDLVLRLNSVLGDNPLVIVVDAIDEWAYELKPQDLARTAARISTSKLKLVVTCKTGGWGEFSTVRGTSTAIERYLAHSPPSRLLPMEAREFHSTLDRYRSFYGVRGAFEREALAAAKSNLFLLRVLFAVAERRGDEHLTFSSLEFFEEYYKQLLDRFDGTASRLAAGHLLKETARLCLSQGSEQVPIYDLQREVGPETVQSALPELLAFQVLERLGDESDSGVRFYFSLLRDFLGAFRIRRWQDRSATELADEMEGMTASDVGVEAVSFFYRYADPEQKRLLDSPCFENALEYTRVYRDVLDRHFSPIRSRFSPFTTSDIGFVGDFIVRHRKMDMYGFRERQIGEDEVLLLARPGFSNESNLPYLHGARRLHHTTDFRDTDVCDQVLNWEIGEQLRSLIDKGELDESFCPELAAETVAVVVSRNRGIFSNTRNAASAGPLFPLEVSKVRRWLRFELLRKHFEELRIDDMRRQGKIAERWEGSTASFSWNPSIEDTRWIEQRATENLDKPDEAVREMTGRSIDSGLTETDRRLSAAMDALEREGLEEIEEPEWLSTARDLYRRLWYHPKPTSEEICRFLEHFFSLGFRVVEKMARHNFPTLYGELPSIRGPFLGVGVVDLTAEPQRQGATLYLCEPDPDQEASRFAVRDVADVDTRILREPHFSFDIDLDGRWRTRIENPSGPHGFITERRLRLNTILHPRRDYLATSPHLHQGTPIPPILRAFVYNWLRVDLESAFRALCQQYGVVPARQDWPFFAHRTD